MKLLDTDEGEIEPEYGYPVDDPLYVIEHEGKVYEINTYGPDKPWKLFLWENWNDQLGSPVHLIENDPELLLQFKAFLRLMGLNRQP